ncbi:MAG: methyltransferase family protein [Woeseia sp.]
MDALRNNQPRRRKLLPPVYFLVVILSIVTLHRYVPIVTLISRPISNVGVLLIGLGLLINLVSVRQFAVRSTAIKPFEESSALVTGGFFRFTRNPMYLGMIIILIGIAVLFGTLSSFLPIPVFVWLIQTHFILKEEAMLVQTFGDQYTEYKKSVRRWI